MAIADLIMSLKLTVMVIEASFNILAQNILGFDSLVVHQIAESLIFFTRLKNSLPIVINPTPRGVWNFNSAMTDFIFEIKLASIRSTPSFHNL